MEAVVVMVDVAGCFLGRRSSFFVCFGAYSEKIMCMAFFTFCIGRPLVVFCSLPSSSVMAFFYSRSKVFSSFGTAWYQSD